MYLYALGENQDGKGLDFIISELMCFMTKTNSRKSRIIIWATKNTPKILKIWEKFSETFWNMRNLTKVFEAQ